MLYSILLLLYYYLFLFLLSTPLTFQTLFECYDDIVPFQGRTNGGGGGGGGGEGGSSAPHFGNKRG